MGNSSPKNVATERKAHLSGEDPHAGAAESGRIAALDQSESVVLLETRRAQKAKTAGVAGNGAGGSCAAQHRSKEIGDQIGKELRGLYADLVAQPVPERFLDLLNQLEAKTISPKTTSKSPEER